MLVSRIVRDIADELNDLETGSEHVRWPLPFLYSYIEQAFNAIKALEPSLFTSVEKIRLNPGRFQVLESQYGSLQDIIGVKRASFKLLEFFNKASLCETKSYRPVTFTIDPHNSRLFQIFPDVPQHPATFVDAIVVKNLEPIAGLNQDIIFPGGDIEKYYNPILDWSLYRAWAKDTESMASAAKSKEHEEAFYRFFGAVSAKETKEEVSKNARGEEF